MLKRYTKHSRSVTRIRYHIILVSKYRRSLGSVIGEEAVKSAIDHAISQCPGVKLLACGFDDNHVHLVIDSPPRWSPSQLVGRIKQLSTYKLWRTHGNKLKMIYRRKKKMLWSNGYFCETVGNVSESTVLECVKNQGK